MLVQYCSMTGTLACISWIRYVQQQEAIVSRMSIKQPGGAGMSCPGLLVIPVNIVACQVRLTTFSCGGVRRHSRWTRILTSDPDHHQQPGRRHHSRDASHHSVDHDRRGTNCLLLEPYDGTSRVRLQDGYTIVMYRNRNSVRIRFIRFLKT